MNTTDLTSDLRQRIAANLTALTVRPLEGPNLRRAAVAITVTNAPDGRPAILLTLRPSKMGRHAGQYALPGGKVDPQQGQPLRYLDQR